MTKTITDIDGVFASGIHAGIKPSAKDLAYIFVPGAVASAGTFTLNKFIAPPLIHTKKLLGKNVLKAVIVNSGNANAATGEKGLKDAKKTAELAAQKLGISASEVGIASTGIIAVPLPIDKIKTGIEKMLKNPLQKNGLGAAEAIMTTDLVSKTVFLEKKIGKLNMIVSGIAKGSGMIAPNMATMLGFFVTNVKLTKAECSRFLKLAVEDSFNMITVDSDTSTNDMVLLFSTGDVKLQKKDLSAFLKLLTEACIDLAKKIVADGEGATRVVEFVVKGALTKKDAKTVAFNVLNSPLVKTAIHGADPNWGRIFAAAGKDPSVKFSPEKVDLFFADHQLVSKGKTLPYNTQEIVSVLKQNFVTITLNLNAGKLSARAWGCDLSKAYIDINTKYN